MTSREELIRNKSNERALLLGILQTHGALEEYSRLQQSHLDTVSRLNEVNARIDSLRRFEEGKSALRIEQELLQQRARRDYDERRVKRERAVTLFNTNSEHLYSAPGSLVIDVGPKGFKFNVEIERSGSQGISSMKVFCYDLMLAQLWSNRTLSPNMLIHDSTIFDGVDERQEALALELVASEARTRSFQYICTLNSDTIPRNEFSTDFNLDSFVRLRLSDATEDGGLLGIRF